MSQAEKAFEASRYAAGDAHGQLSKFDPGTRTLPAGFRIDPRFRSLPTDVVFDKDVAVTLRDGVTIYVDVFRPVGSEKAPVLVAWSPYGKSQGTAPSVTSLYAMLGMDNGALSGLEKFEGPDPAYWCAQGYAICNPDPRGIAESQGDSAMFGRQEGEDCHDLIEWLAVQDWCNGKVAMSGTSYLTISQWFTAAEQPPHLAAISPCEGLSDVYRDLVMRGGMPDIGFAERLQNNSYAGNNRREDILTEAERYPLVNDLWADKTARFDKITIPAYVVASYSNTLHTAGTFRGWRRIASPDKWLRIHNTQEWPDYYDEANVEDLRRFFDHYLKGVDNGWEQTPRVRYSVLDLEGGDLVNQPADEFPPPGVTNTRFYLDGRTRTLSPEPPTDEATAAYDTAAAPALASFAIRFGEQTTMVGYPKVRLWVEAQGADDMDLFVLVQKLDRHGSPLQQFTVPNHGALMQDLTERGGSVLRYKGSNGRLRVSLRHLDEALTTDAVPAHSFDRIEKLSPGEVVDVEIELFPVGLVFYPGEQLRLVISAQNALGAIMPMTRDYLPRNSGRHVIHTGAAHASYLQLPIAAPETTPYAVELVSGPSTKGGVDHFELLHARRALARLKALIGRQGLLDLLAGDVDEGNAYLKAQAELSSGEFRSATTVLAARGIKALQFVRWLESSFSNESVLLAAEPEHFVIAPNPDATVTVVENLGPHICRVHLPAYDAAANLASEQTSELLPESDYPFRRLADLRLPDGTVVGRVLTQFGDTEEGFTAHLTCYFPVSCPEEIFEHHRQHLAVEFRNWIVAAAAAQH